MYTDDEEDEFLTFPEPWDQPYHPPTSDFTLVHTLVPPGEAASSIGDMPVTSPLVPQASPQHHSPAPTYGDYIRYYIPILSWFPVYQVRHRLFADVLAGITVACLIIPQSLSFASLVSVSPIHGLYTAFAAGLMYAIMGTNRQLSVGPEALIAMLVGNAVAQHSVDPEDGIDGPSPALIAGTLTLFVGIINLGLGLLRLGFLEALLSKALLRGFVSAVAFVILVGQSIPMLGLGALAEQQVSEDASALEKLHFIIREAHATHGPTALLAFSSVAILLGVKWLKRRLSVRFPRVDQIPEILLLIIVTIYLSGRYKWTESGIPILGPVEGGGHLPSLHFPAFLTLSRFVLHDLAVSAAMIAVLGFVETSVIARTHAARHGYICSANRELVALGGVNILTAVAGGFAGFGSMARSMINDKAGAQSQVSGLVTSLVVGGMILFGLEHVQNLPRPVLAAVIFVAALGLLNEAPHDISFLLRLGAWRDLGLLLAVFLITTTISVETGTVMAVGVSILLVVRRTTRPRISLLGREGYSQMWRPVDATDPTVHPMEGILAMRIDERALFFANVGQLKDRFMRLERYRDQRAHPARLPGPYNGVVCVIMDFSHVMSIDASAAAVLVEVCTEYRARGVAVWAVGLEGKALGTWVRCGLGQSEISGVRSHLDTVAEAVAEVEVFLPQSMPLPTMNPA